MNYNQREIARLKADILKELAEDVKADLEREGVNFIEGYNAQEVINTDTKSVGTIKINKGIAEELRDPTVTRLAGELAKTYKRERFR